MNGMIKMLAAVVAMGALAGTADAAKGRGAKGEQAGGTAHKGVQGKIVSVTVNSTDATKATIVIHNRKAGDVSVQVDASTVVKVDKKAATVADLKPGMRARIVPATGTAQRVSAWTKGPRAGGKGGHGGKGGPAGPA